jgi:hypothetical protein
MSGDSPEAQALPIDRGVAARASANPHAMNIPHDVDLLIVSCRGYWDFPRYLLARDPDGEFWLLDCRFSDEKDEYEDYFAVIHCGSDAAVAAQRFSVEAMSDTPTDVVGHVLVKHVRFDETHKRSFSVLR